MSAATSRFAGGTTAKKAAIDCYRPFAVPVSSFDDAAKIDIGMLADFTILSADIMKIPEPEILKTRCVITVIGGEIVYKAD